MCFNIAINGKFVENGGYFISRKSIEARYDDPYAVNIARVHFPELHQNRKLEIPDSLPIEVYTDDGFKQKTVSIPNELIPYATKGRWAVAVGIPPYEEENCMGGWYKDGYGCYLAYGIPVGQPIEFIGEGFMAGPSGLIYEIGEQCIKIPFGTKYALYVRCSDSEKNSGFVIFRLEWVTKTKFLAHPQLFSLFKAPHDFPATGILDDYPIQLPTKNDSLDAAIELAELIAEHKGFDFARDRDSEPKLPCYDYFAACYYHLEEESLD